jgi:hypothetical protein
MVMRSRLASDIQQPHEAQMRYFTLIFVATLSIGAASAQSEQETCSEIHGPLLTASDSLRDLFQSIAMADMTIAIGRTSGQTRDSISELEAARVALLPVLLAYVDAAEAAALAARACARGSQP